MDGANCGYERSVLNDTRRHSERMTSMPNCCRVGRSRRTCWLDRRTGRRMGPDGGKPIPVGVPFGSRARSRSPSVSQDDGAQGQSVLPAFRRFYVWSQYCSAVYHDDGWSSFRHVDRRRPEKAWCGALPCRVAEQALAVILLVWLLFVILKRFAE